VLISEALCSQTFTLPSARSLRFTAFRASRLANEMTAIRTLVANWVWIYVIFPSRRVRHGLLSSCGVIGSSSLFGMIAVLRSTRRWPND
jgi:hypothetical protein